MENNEHEIKAIEGAGGGKGGGGRPAQEAPNTLSSRAIVKILEVISEGEIVGIAGGAQGIYINDTPLQNADDSYNFDRAVWDYRAGLPSQPHMAGFPSVEAEIAVGTTVTTTSSVTRTTSSSSIDAVRVTIQLPQGLSSQDTGTGDLNGTTVDFAIDHKLTSSGSWVQVGAYNIEGKTTTPFERQYRIERPTGTGTWDIRVRRITADSASASLRNNISVARVTEVQDIKLPYNDTAYVGLGIDAESVGNQIPKRSYLVKGVKIKVPSNYNPTTRVYTGIWNGTFQVAWTDNPAWVLYDLITNQRYGLGEFITEAQVDKWSFYDAAVYNDQLVNDGKGGQEPRFTFNAVISSREEAFRLLSAVAGAMRGSLIYANGVVKLLQDRPADPVKLVTKANVIDGKFDYRSSGLFERHTAFNVTFNDRTDRHLQRVITVDASNCPSSYTSMLTTAENRYGYSSVDISAFGATTEGQAIRHALWALDTELNQTEVVQFKMSFNGFDLFPGDIIKLWDEDYTATAGAGRVVSVVGTTVTVDRPVTLSPGSKIDVVLADGRTIEQRDINEGVGSVSTFTIATAFSQSVLEGADYVLTTAVSPRQFRILSLKQEDNNIIGVEAVYHDPNKYSRVEANISIPAPVFTTVKPFRNNAPTALEFREIQVNNANEGLGGLRRSLLCSWVAPTEGVVRSYVVRYRLNSGEWVRAEALGPSYEIAPAFAGTYEVEVYAISGSGINGPSVSGSYTVQTTGGGASPLNAPTTLQVVGGGTDFTGSDIFFQWTNPTSNAAVLTATLRDFEVRIVNPSNSAVLRTFYVPAVTAGSTQSSTYSYQMNVADGGPRRSLQVQVRCRDAANNLSSSVSATFNNPAPASISGIAVVGGIGNIKLTWTRPTDADYAGVLVWRSTTTGFTPAAGNLVYDTSSNYISDNVDFGTTYYYKLAAYDQFGRPTDGAGLNISAQQTGAAQAGEGIPEVNGLPSASGYTGPKIVYNTVDGQLYSYVDGAWEPTIPPTSDVLDGSITIAKFASGLRPVEIVTSLPGAPHTEGRMVFLTTDDKLYRNNGTGWTAAVPAGDISGQLTNSQIADLAAAKLTGQVVASQIADAAITTAKFASGIAPVEIVGTLPATGNYEGRTVYLTTDDKLYRHNGTSFISSVPSTDISGQLTDSQLAAIAAAKITGQVASSQIADAAITTAKFASTIKPVEVLSALPGTPHVEGRMVFLTTDDKLYRNTGSGWVSTIASSDITGQLTNSQIADLAAAKLTGQVVASQIADASISTAKFAAGLAPVEIVSSLPVSGNFEGRTVYLTTDDKLYRHNGTSFVSSVPSTDITGQLTDAQLAAIAAAKITGQVASSQIADAAITTAKFAAGLAPVEIVGALPGTGNYEGRTVYLTTDDKLYRHNGTSWISSVPSTDITGQLTDSQLAAIAAAKITGQVATSQIADAAITTAKFAAGIEPVEIVATLPSTGNFEGRVAYLTTDDKLYRHNGTSWISSIPAADITGQLSDSQLAAIAAAKLTGQITGTQITDGAISTAKLAAGSVTTAVLAADAVTADKIAANAVTASEISAGAITTAKIAAGAVTANELAANSVTAGKVAAGAISATEIAAGAITAGKLFVSGEGAALNTDPMATDASAWLQVLGTPSFNQAVTDAPGGSTCLTTVAGQATRVLSNLIPIDPVKNYRYQAYYKQDAATAAAIYHSVAWYDASGVHLVSNTAQPTGAGSPAGWAGSGTYSYAGAVNIAAPTTWTQYTASFGPDETAKIPSNAKFFRVGAILNNGATAAAVVRFTGARVVEKAGADLVVDGAITASKIAAGTITSTQIAADTITAANIAANAITASEISSGAVTTAKIAAGAVTANEIAANAITAGKVAAGAITATEIASGAITTAKLAAGAVTANELAANAVTAGKVAANAITATEIASGSITTAKVAAGAITATEIGAAAVTTAKLAANAVTANEIAANAVTTGKIAAGAVTASQIAANAIVTDKLLVTGQGAALNADPNGQDVSAWTGGTFTSVADSTSPTGTALQISSTGATTLSSAFPLDASKNYNLRISARQVTGTSTTYLGLAFYNAAGTQVTATGWPSTGTFNYFGLVNANPTAGFTEHQISFGPGETAKIAAGAVTARIVLLGNYTGTGAQNFTSLRVMEKASSDLIVDGAITANKITAGAVTTAKLAANAVTANEIAAGAITTAKIAAGAVSANELAASAVTAGKIAAGAISATEIAAGAITASKLVLADTSNMVADPMMLDNNSWVNTSGTAWTNWGVSATEDITFRSTRFMKITGTSGAYAGFHYTRWMPVEPGKQYTIAAQGRSVGGVVNGAAMNVEWADDENRTNFVETNFTYISSNTTTSFDDLFVTAPAGKRFMRLRFYKNNVAVTEVHWGGIIVRRRAEGNLIVDGTITGAKIAANTITASNIAADTITSDKIAANAITASEISSGAVTTAKLAAGAVTADTIAANAVTAGKVAAGAISATEIAAGAVRAQHLLIAPKGLNLDPSFESGATGWTGFVRRLASSSGAVPTGCPVGFAAEFNARDNLAQATIPVVPGEVYRASAWVNRGTGSGGAGIGLVAAVQDAAGLNIAGLIWPGTNTTASGWQRVTGVYTIPANGARLFFGPWADRTSYTGEAWYADLQVEKVNDASLIVDGTITATKIAASTITGSNIAASTITGSNIAADTITATQIAAGAITASELAANSVIAGKVAAGAISATEIAANAITTEKLAVTSIGDSAIRNGSAEEAASTDSTLPAGWVRNTVWGGTSGTAFRQNTTANVRSGTWSIALNPGAGASADISTESIPVSEGDTWYASCWVRSSGTNAGTSPGFYFRMRGGSSPTDVASEWVYQVENVVVPTTWTKYEVTGTIPAGVRWARPVVLNYNTNTGAQLNVDDMEFKKVVTSAVIANGAVTAGKIAANAVTANEIAANTITGGKIAASTITGSNIAASTITASNLAADTITADKIAAGAITSSELAAGAVTAGKVAANAITATEIASNAVTADKVSAGAITTAKLAAGAVTATEIAANAITAGKIAADSIATTNLISEAASIVRFASYNTLTNVTAGNTTYNGTPQFTVAGSITYTTNCFGNRRIEVTGWENATISHTHIAGSTSGPSYQWIVQRIVDGVTTNLLEGVAVNATSGTLQAPLPEVLFDTVSLGTPGTAKSVTYRLVLRTNYGGIASMGVNLSSKTYTSERYIGVSEFQK